MLSVSFLAVGGCASSSQLEPTQRGTPPCCVIWLLLSLCQALCATLAASSLAAAQLRASSVLATVCPGLCTQRPACSRQLKMCEELIAEGAHFACVAYVVLVALRLRSANACCFQLSLVHSECNMIGSGMSHCIACQQQRTPAHGTQHTLACTLPES